MPFNNNCSGTSIIDIVYESVSYRIAIAQNFGSRKLYDEMLALPKNIWCLVENIG